MMRVILLSSALLALQAPVAAAQTATDDQPSTEAWWDRVGSGFFSDPGLTVLREEFDIRAHWTAMSAEDQEVMRQRCAALEHDGAPTAPLPEPGDGGTSITGEDGGAETQRPAPRPFQPADLTAEAGRLRPICAIIMGL